MPKKSKKSKSKRLTLRQKHKVIKKVKEHHKKKAKELKKSGRKVKAPKDPGIPSQWPFKEELLKDLAFQKQRILDQEKKKKEERHAAKVAKRTAEEAGLADGDEHMGDRLTMTDVANEAARSQQQYEARKRIRLAGREALAAAGGKGDGSQRAFLKEFHKVVEAADVVIQVLDARDPAACRCADVERAVLRSGTGGRAKRLILLLNKIDLVPRVVAEAWLKYLREELPTVAFKCSTQKQAANLGQRGSSRKREKKESLPGAKKDKQTTQSIVGMTGSECLGADTLLQLLKNYARSEGMKTSITVGVVGLPNVGKSSLINSLKRARVAQVGNTPGVTRAIQEIHLDKHVTLIDSPGIVFAAPNAGGAAAAALRNCVKVEKLEDPVAPVAEIVARCDAKQLMRIYKVAAFEGADGFLQAVAAARGKLGKGGIPDVTAAARIVLQDWNNGVIPYYTMPPERKSACEGEAAVVDTWAEGFDAERVFANEATAVIQGLASLEDTERFFFEMQSAGPVAMEVLGDEVAAPGGDGEDDAAEDGGGSDMSEGDGPLALPGVSRPLTAVQTPALYDQEGQYNPHAARAEKKRRKKARVIGLEVQDAGEDADFDFNEAFDGEEDAEFEVAEGEEGEEGGESEDEGDDMSEGDGPVAAEEGEEEIEE